jgi:hypothetical protein
MALEHQNLQKPPPSWETSKENVEPLKSGRNVTEMEKNAKLGKEEKEEKVEREKRYEEALAFSSTQSSLRQRQSFSPPREFCKKKEDKKTDFRRHFFLFSL